MKTKLSTESWLVKGIEKVIGDGFVFEDFSKGRLLATGSFVVPEEWVDLESR